MVSAGMGCFARRFTKLALAMLVVCAPSGVRAACDGLLPPVAAREEPARTILAQDLLLLRDIGAPDADSDDQPSPFALSPDGRQLVFLINRADPDTNGYCRGLAIIDMTKPSSPRLIDRGGEIMMMNLGGDEPIRLNGAIEPTSPVWSPDGNWIAFLRRDAGRTRLWIVNADGGSAHAVSKSAVDIKSFTWAPDSQRLLYSSRPGQAEFEKAVDLEALDGWLFDERIVPSMSARPRPKGNLPLRYDAVDIRTGSAVPATTDEHALLDDAAHVADGTLAVGSEGVRATIVQDGVALGSPWRLSVTRASGVVLPCGAISCRSGIIRMWWTQDGRQLRFVRREGWGRSQAALYEWAPGGPPPRLLYRTEGRLIGCQDRRGETLCLYEDSVTPRRLVRIGGHIKGQRLVLDPNPEFAAIRLGTVKRLRWREKDGREAWSDLVLPPGYRPGARLPLVVVQYHSDGFLRGGTGDEMPIHALAAAGMAVLSVERAPLFGWGDPAMTSADAINRAGTTGWSERWNQLENIQGGIDMAIALGIADPAKLGISGLSDGSTSVRFALINRPIFKAAAVGSCCLDMTNVMTMFGTRFADRFQRYGFPPLTRPDADFWRPSSIVLNAAHLDTPLLMQLGDDEQLHAQEGFEALREQGKPAEMYIFPGEPHIKWQPAHRRAMYTRNLDWFAFWLLGTEDPNPAKVGQYARWEAMRAKVEARSQPPT